MKMPLKLTLQTEIIPLLFITITVATVLCFYNYLPDTIVSHWNFSGQADGWTSRTFQGIFFPLLIILIYALMLVMPIMDPRKENYEKFASAYHIFKGLFVAALSLIFLITTAYNLGFAINVGMAVATIIGVLLMIIGFYMRKIKQNWFVGVRTPWALSSPYVWEKTQIFGSWSMITFGVIIIITPYLNPILGAGLFMAGAVALILGTFIYSYLLYSRQCAAAATPKTPAKKVATKALPKKIKKSK